MVDACGDSMSAAEHQPLRELTPQSGGIGKWLLKVAETPLVREYTYSWNGKNNTGKRFEMIMLSSEPGAYCMGQFRRKGATPKGEKEFDQNLMRFKELTTWRASKVSLAKESQCYISSPYKIVIDLNSTKMDPVLQSLYQSLRHWTHFTQS